MEISVEQGRVLGCLVEKELTTPQLYPLTDNALIAACNQSTSRDPVVHYDVATVRLAVRGLRENELVRTVHRPGERSEKHRHLLDFALGLSPAEQALLAVLLLRGPQTVAELRARTERLHSFDAAEEVEQVLDALCHRDAPLVVRLDRQPGRKEDRYAELLVSEQAPAPAGIGGGTEEPAPTPTSPSLTSLAEEVALLRSELAALRAQVERQPD